MSSTTFQVALWIELLAAGLGGLQGALFAAGERHRRIDLLGVIVIGLAVALGGSLLRDVVLNQPPVVIWKNWYLLVAGAAAVLGMLLQPALARAGWLITVLDAVVMGLFGAIGASKALSLGVGEAGALVVGVIGAIGGGMLRDVILSLPISFLQVGTLYAVAAGAGAGSLVLLTAFGAPILIAGLVCVVVTTSVRLAAVRFGWTFPEQGAVRPRRPQPVKTPAE
ncbi:TRIC cation channel family protein [Micromonospora sp. WMMD967]|uniref:trimeric intracellular cation channel family protein n=1 Tax=Micromonospora sp. WMMD967 TaxID=3016101 RepID=UPI002417A3F5|nr:TRIC cation channel family protein [Micromonospora sp. WMMD967]MDG4840144.1 TRIC cation channel family protein [Micromonospora sp. WMMD967]